MKPHRLTTLVLIAATLLCMDGHAHNISTQVIGPTHMLAPPLMPPTLFPFFIGIQWIL